jgi:capsule polysaccharide export protein KpsC/LpsZ
VKFKNGQVLLAVLHWHMFGWSLCRNRAKICCERKIKTKYLLKNRKLFELFDKKVKNYSLFDKFLNPYLNPLAECYATLRVFMEFKKKKIWAIVVPQPIWGMPAKIWGV